MSLARRKESSGFRIYLVTCGASDKRYVGITSRSLADRWSGHVSGSRRKAYRSLLHAAIRQFGVDAFSISEIGSASTWDELCEMERDAIAAHGTFHPGGYNLTLGGDGMPGCVLPPRSVEWRQKMSSAKTGTKVSATTRAKMSAAAKGKKFTAAHRASLSAFQKNRIAALRAKGPITHSDDARKKISKGLAGRLVSDETRAKIRAKRLAYFAMQRATKSPIGRRHSDATKEKLSAIRLAYFAAKRAANSLNGGN